MSLDLSPPETPLGLRSVLHTQPDTGPCAKRMLRHLPVVTGWERRYLIRGSPPQAVGLKVVEAQDLDGPFDAEVVEHAHDLQ